MGMRKIKNAVNNTTGELIYFKGHAKATFMSDGSTVEDAIKNIKPDLSDYVKSEELEGYAKTSDIPSLEGYAKTEDIPSLEGLAKTEDIPSLDGYATLENISLMEPFNFYKSIGGVLNERQYRIMVKYAYTPFMISSNSVTEIPDELLNESRTNFFADWYWIVMRITGGEPIMTTQWNNNIPYKFKGMVSGKIYIIDFINKIITPE